MCLCPLLILHTFFKFFMLTHFTTFNKGWGFYFLLFFCIEKDIPGCFIQFLCCFFCWISVCSIIHDWHLNYYFVYTLFYYSIPKLAIFCDSFLRDNLIMFEFFWHCVALFSIWIAFFYSIIQREQSVFINIIPMDITNWDFRITTIVKCKNKELYLYFRF